MDTRHTGRAIADKILHVVQEFGLENKVFAITVDNASNNTTAMDDIRPILSGYASVHLFHQRCACHIINLIAKCALKHLAEPIEKIRSGIVFLNASNPRLAEYKSWCDAATTTSHVYNIDMSIRWNSTYIMIRDLIRDKQMFTTFVNANSHGTIFLCDADWDIANMVMQFLEVLYDATNILSGVYYPTTPLLVHQIYFLADHLKAHENDPKLREAVKKMKAKFIKYWKEIPDLCAFAFILDPRAKIEGFGDALSLLTIALDCDYSQYQFTIKSKLADLYDKYENKFTGTVRPRRPTQPQRPGKKKIIFKMFASTASGSSSSAAGNELAAYLNDRPLVVHDEDDFNILEWWRDHKQTYPVLSILARDVLTVPVSTTSSEGTFSLQRKSSRAKKSESPP